MTDTPVTPKDLDLAAITGAHGVAGEVRLKLFGAGVDALAEHMSFIIKGTEGVLTLKKVRSDNKGGAIARFAEVSGRGAAEKLRGTVLCIARDALPSLDDGEYYFMDLIGLAVFTDAGDAVGRTVDVQNFGATDIIEIEKDPVPTKGMKTFMVPMTKDAVIEWDDEKLVIAADFVDE
ncbi:MAG: 16S rRNA processing protein RimM [Altererythrobacter sp.]|nr:ribosome maturation factor RimM [Altererythrobacter sp.]NNE50583.1 16S rRNA processing protein RimM [Altererythrobacter sp.]NNF93974.1 16S rRNA processing protein RimM [Altererythrobacter sp.]NNK46677.1 16S rRNA processing protein RimM [Altererythrobacter sp.]